MRQVWFSLSTFNGYFTILNIKLGNQTEINGALAAARISSFFANINIKLEDAKIWKGILLIVKIFKVIFYP